MSINFHKGPPICFCMYKKKNRIFDPFSSLYNFMCGLPIFLFVCIEKEMKFNVPFPSI